MHYSFRVKAYQPPLRELLIGLWEQSVLATHHFLNREDFLAIKSLVKQINFEALDVYVLLDGATLAGFSGIAGNKLKMLFIAPDYQGKRAGTTLVQHAINSHNVQRVDVNEQNTPALQFYRKQGFDVFDRSETDEMGKPYPIFKMKLVHR